MKFSSLIVVLNLLFFTQITIAQDFKVANITEYNEALTKVNSGGTIILKNGEWKDVNLNAHGNGTKANPIIIKAETPGQVILSGDSNLKIYGSYVIVSGLWFKNGNTTSKSVVQFRKNSKEFANNCRFTNSTISYYNTKDSNLKNHWVDLWGKNNRVDHNNFTGKISEGTTLVVWLKGEEHVENNHIIDYNYFGKRPELGSNGGETIRIGTSANSMKSSKTIVENNTFKHCDGEIEIISNKSGDNIFRNNLFVENKGTLTLRHGNNALVENNVFLGNGVSKTGGIRIINEGHIVRNNLLIGLKGNDYRGAIVMMNGVPNSPLNRYHQIKNVDVQNNTIIDCGPVVFGAGKDDEKTLPPINSVFANNIIANSKPSQIFEAKDDISGITFKGNIADSKAQIDTKYLTKATINWQVVKSLPVPTEDNPALTNVVKTNVSPNVDITDKERTTYVAGAFNLNTTTLPKALRLRVGPGWKPNIVPPVTKAEDLVIQPGIGTLTKTVSKARPGSVIQLKEGVYFIEKSIKVNTNVTVVGAANGGTILKMQEDIIKPFNYFFRVNEGASLTIKNLDIDAAHKSPAKYAIVSPDKMQSGMYQVYAKNCTFKNFTNKNGGSIFKAYTGTFAETLEFTNCKFLKSYRGFNLSYDKDNLGKFNAKQIQLNNCVFKDIEEFAINYIRTTPNLNIKGGKLVITNCVFDKVANFEKGKILRTSGIHEVVIKNSVFLNSYLAKSPIAIAGQNASISNCLISDSGFVKVTKGAQEQNIMYKKPKWEDKNKYLPSAKSPLLKENNGIDQIGLTTTNK